MNERSDWKRLSAPAKRDSCLVTITPGFILATPGDQMGPIFVERVLRADP